MENLAECLKSVEKTAYPDFEIIVVDCLTVGIADYLREHHPSARLVALSEDIGPAAMHNVGLRNADPGSEYIAFLDNDIVADPAWLGELVSCIAKNPQIGAVQSKIMLFDSPGLYNTKGNRANFLAVGWPEGYREPDNGEGSAREITFPSGASMIVRRTALERIGGYDDDFFIYADDMDAGLRMRLAGYTIAYCPGSVILHKYRFLKSPRNFYYLHRNSITTFLKLYGTTTYLKLIPPLVAYELSVFGFALLNGYVTQYARAMAHVLKNLPATREKRRRIRLYRRVTDREMLRQLEGAITFPEVSNHPAVREILNPFLSWYRRLLLSE